MILEQVERGGSYNEEALNRYLAARREDLDSALSFLAPASSGAELNARLEFVLGGRQVTRGPSPSELPQELVERSAVIGAERGRARALAENLRDPVTGRFVNPFEHIGRFGQGFDDIMLRGTDRWHDPVAVVEYKGGGARLDPGQMELDWVVGNIRRLYLEGGPSGREWARVLSRALSEGRLEGVAFSTPLEHGVPQETTVIDRWHYPATHLADVLSPPSP